ncbi:MAG: 4-(cytidine 5'-diphospho)-2-C-methyl-D-erythritol kinase, partial [Burkholderiales bacterium]|nr:4-(cytidine 5'-diphospho)-2-C-methyl-D-erythritol kinase [Burkholderiales bacterium]
HLDAVVRDDGELVLTRPAPGVAPDDDLVMRAARALKAVTGVRAGASLALVKRLPQGGGVGGGSSDAATTLIALNHLWGTGLRRHDLQALALTLGADVPVFVFGRNAFAEGVGEELQAVDLPPRAYAVLVPPVGVATARVFADPALTRDTPPATLAAFFRGPTRNDLQRVVASQVPEVAQAVEWLGQFGQARMTGSGACVFVELDSEEQARTVVAQRPVNFAGFAARGLQEHPLRALVQE